MLRSLFPTASICLIAVIQLANNPMLRAADQNQSANSDGYKAVPVGSNHKVLRVKDTPNIYQHIASSPSTDKYQPDQPDYGRTSSLANKQFSSPGTSFSKNDSNLEDQERKTFITKSYFGKDSFQTDSTTPNLNTKILPTATSAYQQSASGFNKSFATSRSTITNTKTATFATTTSSYQGRTAVLGGKKIDTFAETAVPVKPYTGPEVANARKDSLAVNDGLSRVSGLPNRPLTIDEVRELLNHETKPDLDAKPEPASKPLNDPDYKPVPSPEPPPVSDHNDSDAVPPPGTLAAPPENSEPLPK